MYDIYIQYLKFINYLIMKKKQIIIDDLNMMGIQETVKISKRIYQNGICLSNEEDMDKYEHKTDPGLIFEESL